MPGENMRTWILYRNAVGEVEFLQRHGELRPIEKLRLGETAHVVDLCEYVSLEKEAASLKIEIQKLKQQIDEISQHLVT